MFSHDVPKSQVDCLQIQQELAALDSDQFHQTLYLMLVIVQVVREVPTEVSCVWKTN